MVAVLDCDFVFLWGFDSVYLWFCFCWLGTGPIGLPCHRIRLDAGLSDGKKKKKKKSVPQKEKDRRMAAGECLKCGKFGHIAKDCRTGWKYDLAVTPEIKAIKRSKQRNRKRKWKEQADYSETD